MNKPNPIKPFKSIEEEALFWDTHDVSPILEGKNASISELPMIEKDKKSSLTLRIQSSIKNRLNHVARIKGINASTLSRMMLIEKLEELEYQQAQRIREKNR